MDYSHDKSLETIKRRTRVQCADPTPLSEWTSGGGLGPPVRPLLEVGFGERDESAPGLEAGRWTRGCFKTHAFSCLGSD